MALNTKITALCLQGRDAFFRFPVAWALSLYMGVTHIDFFKSSALFGFCEWLIISFLSIAITLWGEANNRSRLFTVAASLLSSAAVALLLYTSEMPSSFYEFERNFYALAGALSLMFVAPFLKRGQHDKQLLLFIHRLHRRFAEAFMSGIVIYFAVLLSVLLVSVIVGGVAKVWSYALSMVFFFIAPVIFMGGIPTDFSRAEWPQSRWFFRLWAYLVLPLVVLNSIALDISGLRFFLLGASSAYFDNTMQEALLVAISFGYIALSLPLLWVAKHMTAEESSGLAWFYRYSLFIVLPALALAFFFIWRVVTSEHPAFLFYVTIIAAVGFPLALFRPLKNAAIITMGFAGVLALLFAFGPVNINTIEDKSSYTFVQKELQKHQAKPKPVVLSHGDWTVLERKVSVVLRSSYKKQLLKEFPAKNTQNATAFLNGMGIEAPYLTPNSTSTIKKITGSTLTDRELDIAAYDSIMSFSVNSLRETLRAGYSLKIQGLTLFITHANKTAEVDITPLITNEKAPLPCKGELRCMVIVQQGALKQTAEGEFSVNRLQFYLLRVND